MILFAVYAVLVWYFVARHRREVWGFVIAVGGAVLAAGLTALTARVLNFRLLGPLLVLMWAEVAIVGAVGIFIASLPRRPTGRHCAFCWYDLGGPTVLICPECGRNCPLAPLPVQLCSRCGAEVHGPPGSACRACGQTYRAMKQAR